jgi:hypothetical protein
MKKRKQLPNCLNRAETNVVLIVFIVTSVKSALTYAMNPVSEKLYLGQ